ncbi:MAG TPA: hypothetical protein PK447_01950 [Ignavibacteria bacterium]|nr:hypothetical protein [Ignavibacteria bacterium]
MRNFKYIMAAIAITILVSGFANAATNDTKDPYPSAIKIRSLNYQITNEIKDLFTLPVYLKYSDKNLKGTTTVLISVAENGKIGIEQISGLNNQLNNYVRDRIESLNLWTSPIYGKSQFIYKFIVS